MVFSPPRNEELLLRLLLGLHAGAWRIGARMHGRCLALTVELDAIMCAFMIHNDEKE